MHRLANEDKSVLPYNNIANVRALLGDKYIVDLYIDHDSKLLQVLKDLEIELKASRISTRVASEYYIKTELHHQKIIETLSGTKIC